MSLFSFLRHRRRARILRDYPIPTEIWVRLLRDFPTLTRLSGSDQALCQDMAAIFAREKKFYPQGVPWSEEKTWTLSALCVLPVLHLGLDALKDFSSIYIRPRFYCTPRIRQEGYLEVQEMEELSGEVTELGALVFSWEDVRASGQGTGFNVAVHEMAHVLDALNGRNLDGMPRLKSTALEAELVRVFQGAWSDLQSRKRRAPPIDPYGAESPEEFFAVVLEEFFDRPRHLERIWPEVYRVVLGWWKSN